MQTMEPHQQLHSFFLSTTRGWILRRNYYKTLYLIFDYPYKYYTFKHFEV